MDNSQTIEGLDANEVKLYEIRKHWAGLVLVYLVAGFAFGVLTLLAWYLVPTWFAATNPNRARPTIVLIIGVTGVLTWLGLVLYTYIYRESRLIITNKNLTQIVQTSLFSRRVSELKLSNVEDVTANQKGFLASIFNYGDLNIETAGARENFSFSFCPNPNYFGKVVLDARQECIDREKRNS